MLICLSSNHRNASFELLERLSIAAPAATLILARTEPFITGAIVLATCNRFEAYLDIDEPLIAAVAVESVLYAIGQASDITEEELRASITVHQGDAVVEHLFAVSSGLESVIIGESEISGQVSRALETARAEGTTSRDLERLFQKATHTSRRVKNSTAIGGAGRSVVHLALELVSSRIANWADTRVLVVGTGNYAAATIVALRSLGANDLRVFSPSGRGVGFAARHSLTEETTLARALSAVDLVITCTTDTVIGPDAFNRGRRQIVIDLGLPRNVHPDVGRLENIELVDLEIVRLHAPLEELNAHDGARTLIEGAAAGFAADLAAAPAIAAVRRQVLGTVEAEIARARSRGAGKETEAALRHLAGVLLHQPSLRIRELAGQGRITEVITTLDLLGIQVPPDVDREEHSKTA